MKPMNKTYSANIERLEELLVEEHTSACDCNTCDINASFDSGYVLWALYLFDSSGASSDEFNELYSKLPKRFLADAERERKALVKDVEHIECPECNAVIWDPHSYCSDVIHCSSCASDVRLNKGDSI